MSSSDKLNPMLYKTCCNDDMSAVVNKKATILSFEAYMKPYHYTLVTCSSVLQRALILIYKLLYTVDNDNLTLGNIFQIKTLRNISIVYIFTITPNPFYIFQLLERGTLQIWRSRIHGGTFGNESLLKKTTAERQLQRLRKRKESTSSTTAQQSRRMDASTQTIVRLTLVASPLELKTPSYKLLLIVKVHMLCNVFYQCCVMSLALHSMLQMIYRPISTKQFIQQFGIISYLPIYLRYGHFNNPYCPFSLTSLEVKTIEVTC
ncbi:hypothetical protein AGLY_018285 [Aphis glycines]|uniref:Uncharacterized protein n=1 Tax=Aphis glycines TaxID=307491 RepID=A0A6G0SSG6_APHGL|nr:hypothetical protein AGLY_018285 [Aphis glycines]